MIELNNAQCSAIVTAIHNALELPLTRSVEIEEMRLQAYAEIVSDPMNATDTLALGEAIDTKIMLAGKDDLFVDPSALIEVHGKQMVRRALHYAGVSPDEHGTKTVWTFGKPNSRSRILKIPDKMLQEWFSDL